MTKVERDLLILLSRAILASPGCYLDERDIPRLRSALAAVESFSSVIDAGTAHADYLDRFGRH
jgi:hypothetical protein